MDNKIKVFYVANNQRNWIGFRNLILNKVNTQSDAREINMFSNFIRAIMDNIKGK